jgi:hypothetical protein
MVMMSAIDGWSEPVPGRELHPLWSSAFHGALFQQLLIISDLPLFQFVHWSWQTSL